MLTELARGSATGNDRRAIQRFSISAPVTLTAGVGEIQAYTRDLSSEGLYFYVASAEGLSIDQDLDLFVTLPPELTLSTSCLIRCQARLVRIENTPSDLTGIAARILHYWILSKAERDD
jgi:hypothetical protein